MAGHRYTVLGRLELPVQIAGPASQIHVFLSLARDAFLERGGIWLVRLVPGDLLILTRGGDLSGEIQGPGTSRAHKTLRDTPGRFRGVSRPCRYRWSWPEPPAGATPSPHRSRRAPGGTGHHLAHPHRHHPRHHHRPAQRPPRQCRPARLPGTPAQHPCPHFRVGTRPYLAVSGHDHGSGSVD